MSGEGRPAAAVPDAAGLRVAIAVTRWNADITDVLLERALEGRDEALLAAELADDAAPVLLLDVLLELLERLVEGLDEPVRGEASTAPETELRR